MGGGLLQLVAYGAQDIYLTGNPQITFFKTVFRRHTNFAIQSVEQTINGSVKSGSKINFNISRDGDLLSNIILKMDGQTDDSFSCIEYVECEIGGQVIDKQYNLWMNIWCDLTHDLDKTKMLNKLRNGIDTTTTTMIVDQNQPSPAALNNIAVDEIISYPGTEDVAPKCIIKHPATGTIYFSKSVGSNNILTRINVDGTVEEAHPTTHFGISIHEIDIDGGHNIYGIQQGNDYVTRLTLSATNGIGNAMWRHIVGPGKANAGANEGLNPSISNGVDTIGYYAGGLNSVTANSNMLLLASNSVKKIISRVYFNEDQHYQETVYNVGNVPVGSTTVLNNGIGLNDGDYTNAQLPNGRKILRGSPDNSTLVVAMINTGVIKKINLSSGNFETTTIVGDNSLGPNVDQRGHAAGGPGVGQIHGVHDLKFFPNNPNMILATTHSPLGAAAGYYLRTIDLTTSTISPTYGPFPIQVFDFHPSGDYIIGCTNTLNATLVKVNLNTTPYTSETWLQPNYVKNNTYPWGIHFSPDGNALIQYSTAYTDNGLYYYFDVNTPHPDQANIHYGTKTSTYYARQSAIDWNNNIIYHTEVNTSGNPGVLKRQGISPRGSNLSFQTTYTYTAGYPIGIGNNTQMGITNDGVHMYVNVDDHKLDRVNLLNASTLIPNYYFKQHTSILKDVNGTQSTIHTMKIADNNDIYLFFTDKPGLYKVAAGADREDTPTYLCPGSEVIERGNGILIHTDGTLYLSCRQTHKIYKYKDDVFTHIAGSGTEGNDNNANPLEASFSSPRGLCITNYNDLLICDDDNSNPKKGDVRVMGGYKPVTVTTTVSIPEPSYVPLQFWFCRNPGLALPLIALQYHEVRIIIQLAESLNNVTNIEAWGDYIYLDTDERRRFAQLSHEYLIEQTQFSNRLSLGQHQITNSTSKEISNIEELRFNHPVKEVVWTIEQVNDDENLGKASACSILNNGGTQAIRVNSALLQFNGSDRFYERDGKYFGDIQRYQKHTGAGLRNTRLGVGSNDLVSTQVTSKWYPKVSSVQLYSFALNPEEHQPSSTCNFSRLDNAIIKNVFETTSHNGTYSYFLNVFAHNYNVLRIMSGMGGLAYSN